jgi:hypothetical protein
MLAQNAQLKLIGPPIAVPCAATSNVVFHTAIVKGALADVICRVFHRFKFGLLFPKFITQLWIEKIDCFYSDIGFIYVGITLNQKS